MRLISIIAKWGLALPPIVLVVFAMHPQTDFDTSSKLYDLKDQVSSTQLCTSRDEKLLTERTLSTFQISFVFNSSDFLTLGPRITQVGNLENQLELVHQSGHVYLLIPFLHSSSMRFPVDLGSRVSESQRIDLEVWKGRFFQVKVDGRIIYLHNYGISSFYTDSAVPLKCYFDLEGQSIFHSVSIRTFALDKKI